MAFAFPRSLFVTEAVLLAEGRLALLRALTLPASQSLYVNAHPRVGKSIPDLFSGNVMVPYVSRCDSLISA